MEHLGLTFLEQNIPFEALSDKSFEMGKHSMLNASAAGLAGASQQKAVEAYQNIGRNASNIPAHSDANVASPVQQKKP